MVQVSDIEVPDPATVDWLALRSYLNDRFNALNSGHIGAGTPGSATAGTVWATTGNLLQYYDGASNYPVQMAIFAGSVSGTDTVTATLAPTPASLNDVSMFYILWAGANTGAVTLDLNSLGAKSVVKANGTALAASDLATGLLSQLWYDSGNDRFQVVGL